MLSKKFLRSENVLQVFENLLSYQKGISKSKLKKRMLKNDGIPNKIVILCSKNLCTLRQRNSRRRIDTNNFFDSSY